LTYIKVISLPKPIMDKKRYLVGLIREGRGMVEFFVAMLGGIWFLIVIVAMLSGRENSDNN
jgi:hypothetical protein